MVIVAYFRDQNIRARVANLLILNLAITDLTVGALMWPFNLTWLIKDYWPFGEVLYFFIPLTIIVVLNVAVYTNIKRRSKGIVGQSPADGLPTRATTQANDGESLRQDMCKPSAGPCFKDQGTLADSSNTSANAYTEPTEALPNENVSKNAPQSNGSGSKERTFARHRKAAVVLGILVGCFLVCLLPVQVTSVKFAICGKDCVSFLTLNVTYSFVWGNSMINPFIYAVTNKHFRCNFRRYLLLDRWAYARKQRGP
eukprot:XP_003729650.1 PREDICTED: D(4) dopamine receptor-like [Strongylocentrotus purpuratus]